MQKLLQKEKNVHLCLAAGGVLCLALRKAQLLQLLFSQLGVLVREARLLRRLMVLAMNLRPHLRSSQKLCLGWVCNTFEVCTLPAYLSERCQIH